jgi:AAHS family 4-hydroxybenzoate transporter-like MFS transporter
MQTGTGLFSPIDITEVIDSEPFGRFRRFILGTCLLVMMLDTIDASLMAYAASPISGLWHISIARFGPVFSVGLVGSFVGSVGFGQAADTFGRRRTLIVGVALFGLGSLLQGTAGSLQQLLPYRFLGVCLGNQPRTADNA